MLIISQRGVLPHNPFAASLISCSSSSPILDRSNRVMLALVPLSVVVLPRQRAVIQPPSLRQERLSKLYGKHAVFAVAGSNSEVRHRLRSVQTH